MDTRTTNPLHVAAAWYSAFNYSIESLLRQLRSDGHDYLCKLHAVDSLIALARANGAEDAAGVVTDEDLDILLLMLRDLVGPSTWAYYSREEYATRIADLLPRVDERRQRLLKLDSHVRDLAGGDK